MAGITGAHHTSFTVADLDRSLTFFRDVLGLEVLFTRDEEANLVWASERLVTFADGTQSRNGEAAAPAIQPRPAGDGILTLGLLTATHAHQRRDITRRWRNWQTH